jgi:hypothetical protein
MTLDEITMPETFEHSFGCLHSLPLEVQQSIIEFARNGAAKTRKHFDDVLCKQKELGQQKEE